MPYRKTVLATGEVYHIYNRSVGRIPIFTSWREYQRFQSLLDYYRFLNLPLSYSHFIRLSKDERQQYIKRNIDKAPLSTNLFAYCLMENHYHLLLKQITDNGISKMVSNVQNGYAKYFNLRHDRRGPLFESIFKAVRIVTDEQLLHVSRYIHLNPYSSYALKFAKLFAYPWSSLPYYIGKQKQKFVSTKFILELIGGPKEYKSFVTDQADYQRELAKIKHLTLE